MEANKFLKEMDRMCKSYGNGCKGCELFHYDFDHVGCSFPITEDHREWVIKVVEEWSESHPEEVK